MRDNMLRNSMPSAQNQVMENRDLRPVRPLVIETNAEPITEVFNETRETYGEDTVEAENTYEMEGVLPYLTMGASNNKSNFRNELRRSIQ